MVMSCFVGVATVWDGGSEQRGASAAEATTGEQIYQRYCKMCHAMGPPPKIAPPVKGLARHYREAFSEKEAAVDHMVAFMQKPDPAMSKCRPQAIERFGLMPAMTIAENKLRAVSGWVWEQYDPKLKRHHHGEGGAH